MDLWPFINKELKKLSEVNIMLNGFKVLGTNRGGRSSPFLDVDSKLIVSKHFGNKKNNKYALSFYFGSRLLKRIGWKIGDYLQFGYDYENRLGYFMKVIERTVKSYKLTRNNLNNERGRITISWQPDFPSVNSAKEAENLIIRDGGLLFEWPRP